MISLKDSHYLCCNDYDKIVKILNACLFGGSMGAILNARYQQMKDYLDNPHQDWKDLSDCKIVYGKNSGRKDLPDVQLQVSLNKIPSLKKEYGSKYNLGHDLPFWITNIGMETKRIMLISQDPLRNGQASGIITLSTPFGMHSIDYRGNKVYTQIIDGLIKKNCSVYLTDCHKLYATESQINESKTPSSIGSSPNDRLILQKEIDFFLPDKIVAMGNKARDLLTDMGYQPMHVPHPSAPFSKAKYFPHKKKVDWYINEILK